MIFRFFIKFRFMFSYFVVSNNCFQQVNKVFKMFFLFYDLVINQRTKSFIETSNFSFSLKEESFFIIALHPASSRPLRRFKYPVLIFNPHIQFEELRGSGKYDKMKYTVRKRDLAYSGSINPMLTDFGEASEVYQYSGREYDHSWQCPLKINHAAIEHNSAT